MESSPSHIVRRNYLKNWAIDIQCVINIPDKFKKKNWLQDRGKAGAAKPETESESEPKKNRYRLNGGELDAAVVRQKRFFFVHR